MSTYLMTNQLIIKDDFWYVKKIFKMWQKLTEYDSRVKHTAEMYNYLETIFDNTTPLSTNVDRMHI